ncbi:hypothetical protein TWF281_009000 [Arthrobotrys megalospora]
MLESTVIESTAGPTIQSIPLELRLSILSYLDIKQVKEFSLCSRSCRAASLPIIYRRLNLGYIDDLSKTHVLTPISRLEEIRAAFANPDGSLHNLQDVVRHVTIDNEDLVGIDNLVSYYRGWISLLPLFPALNSLKILYFTPSVHALYGLDPDFDTRLFNASCSVLVATCPTYQALKRLYIKSSEYRHAYPTSSLSREEVQFTADNEIFLGLNPGESVLKYSSPETIPFPQALEEAYLDIDFRVAPVGTYLDVVRFIIPSMATLKKLGVWVDLHSTGNSLLFPRSLDLTHITDLGLCLDFLNHTRDLDELGERCPNLESLSLYVDNGSEGGFWEEQAMKSYGRIVGIWEKTLKYLRLPWFTEGGELEPELDRTVRIHIWFRSHNPAKLEKVVLVRQIPGDYFQAVACFITGTGKTRELTWSEVYLEEKLPLDGLIVLQVLFTRRLLAAKIKPLQEMSLTSLLSYPCYIDRDELLSTASRAGRITLQGTSEANGAPHNQNLRRCEIYTLWNSKLDVKTMPRVSFELIPTELVFQVLSYLPLEDLKNLSLCSKSCRANALPAVFYHVKFNLNSPEPTDIFSSFEDGGFLAHIRQGIKHATLDCSAFDTSIDKKVECCQLFATKVHLLPALRYLSLGLVLPIAVLNQYPDFTQRLFYEIFRRLADNSPAYYSIKRVCMSVRTMVPQDGDSISTEFGKQTEQLNEESKTFLRLQSTNETSEAATPTDIYFPPNTEELFFDYNQHQYKNWPLYPLSSILTARATLKKVCLNITHRNGSLGPKDYGFPDGEFPNVKTLQIHPHFLYDEAVLFRPLVRLFPNVEDLSVYLAHQMWSENRTLYARGYDSVSLFPKVRKIRMFWFEEDFGQLGTEFMMTWELEYHVKRWAEVASMLENVVFVRSAPMSRGKDGCEAVAVTIGRMNGGENKAQATWTERYEEEKLAFDAL